MWNYCPLAFLEKSGRNRTPDKLPPRERDPLFEVCDRALMRLVNFVTPEHVLGIGKFSQQPAEALLEGRVKVGGILHPSPANPAANRGWARQAEIQLEDLGIELPRGRTKR